MCKAKSAHKEIGRPLKIDPENEKIIIAKIISKRDSYDFMTITQIIKFVEENFKKSITKGWVNSFIYRHKDELDESRLKVPRRYLKDFLDIVKVLITISPAELIYNIDETGLSDWEEKKPKIVVIPKELEYEKLNYPTNRGNRHVTLVFTILAGDDAYFPMAIASDSSLEKVFDLGIRRDTDLILKVSNSSYMNKDIFKVDIDRNFAV